MTFGEMEERPPPLKGGEKNAGKIDKEKKNNNRKNHGKDNCK